MTDASSKHIAVLLQEVVDWLRPEPGKRYLDGTLGLGGHSEAILKAGLGRAELAGLDRDENALSLARERLKEFGGAHLFHLPFSEFEQALDKLGWKGVDGAVLDLGVSSMQLDEAERGFSFMADGPLDMRMDASGDLESAEELVNTLNHGQLARIIREYGGDPMAGKIASAILREREKQEITTTLQLAAIVERAYPPKMRRQARKHPATRTFQGLRIAVNRELEELDTFLSNIIGRLNPGARLAIISFHSLEDRAVKWAFREAAKTCTCPRHQMICTCDGVAKLKILTKKPLVPTEEEMRVNVRSRSAKLRVAQRLGPDGEET